MPIYAYRCATCGHARDLLRKISDPPLPPTCPACGAETFEKQVTAAGFQLKGSGWYVTDFRGGNTHGASGKPAEAEGGAAKSDGAKGDAAPASAPATSSASSSTPAASPAPSAAAGSSSSGGGGSST